MNQTVSIGHALSGVGGGAGAAAIAIGPLPCNPLLTGLDFYFQAINLDPAGVGPGITVTSGLQMTI